MSASPPQSSEQWLARVASVQREKATPEMLENMRARSEALRHTKLKAKKASRIHNSMQLSSSAFTSNMKFMSSAPSRSTEFGGRACSAMAMLSSPAMMSPMSAPANATIEEEEAAEEALEEALGVMVQQQVAEGALEEEDVALAHATVQGGEAARTAQEANLDDALTQLETEPADAAACAAKFELYEGFAKLTEDTRAATLELWAQSEADFDGAPAAKAQIRREIERVDREENLGIHEDPRRWFVHGMCRAAAKNQKILNGVLGGITTKLELLASQTNCPICFEDFGPDRPSTTLGCAHKACQECWQHWTAVGGNGLCPLCRHPEFLHRMLDAERALGVADHA